MKGPTPASFDQFVLARSEPAQGRGFPPPGPPDIGKALPKSAARCVWLGFLLGGPATARRMEHYSDIQTYIQSREGRSSERFGHAKVRVRPGKYRGARRVTRSRACAPRLPGASSAVPRP